MDSRSKFSTFFITPSRKTIGAVVLKFLTVICQCLKVCPFDAFVNRSSTANFMITKTSRRNFYEIFKRGAYINMVEIGRFISIYGGMTHLSHWFRPGDP